MYTITQYLKDTFSLTGSLVIKMNDVGVKINEGHYLATGDKPPASKREWKYYLNLSGVKHTTNSEVTVYVTETNTTEVLTKELLDTNRVTRSDLMKRAESYKVLTEKYPDDLGYIIGCIQPTDIDVAINAPDGAILNYNRSLVGDNEISIMRYLDVEVRSYVNRWHVRDYCITDELYLPAFLATMYAAIPSLILELRTKRIYTAEAHGFHIEHYFRSRLGIWDEITRLSQETIFWLYRNLNYLLKHAGSNKTLAIVIEKIFERNGIGVGYYQLETHDPEVVVSQTDVTKSLYELGEVFFTAVGLNGSYNSVAVTPKTIEEMVSLELFNSPTIETPVNTDTKDTLVRSVTDELESTGNSKQPTKVLDLGVVELFKTHGNDELSGIMDHWLYYAYNGTYSSRDVYVDPNNKNEYELSPMDGLLVFYYLVSVILGSEEERVTGICYLDVVDSSVTADYLLNNLYNRSGSEHIANTIVSNLPSGVRTLSSSEQFKGYIDQLIQLYSTTWVLDSNVNNASVSSNIKHMVSRLYKSGECVISSSGVKLADLLTDKELLPNITSTYSIDKAIVELFKTFTGRDLNKYTSINQATTAYGVILEKLTSYTTHIIKTDTSNVTLHAPYSTIEAHNPDAGIINVTEAGIVSPYELVDVGLVGIGNDYRSSLDGVTTQAVPSGSVGVGLNGFMVNLPRLPDSLTGSVTEPVTYAEMLTDTYTPFVPTVGANANTYDSGAKTSVAYDVNVMNEMRTIETELVTYTRDLMEQPLVGVTTAPNTIVEIED